MADIQEPLPASTNAFHSGRVALIGKPNVGKSTLVNRIVGHKVSIVSNKPQTTRRRVLGIANGESYQIAFVDTPGIHDPHHQLGRAMVDQARGSLSDVDLVLLVVDGSHHAGAMDQQIAGLIKESQKDRPVSVLLCLNKMDQLKAEDVQRNVDAYSALAPGADYMMTTATTGQNVDRLVEMIVERLPEKPPAYPKGEYTDQSSQFLVAEFIREKILQATRQEVPHSVAVHVDEWEIEGNLVRISATVLVEKQSQRAILIGHQGQFIKDVGSKARREIEAMIGSQIYLDLHVKVDEDWRMNPRTLHELQYSD